MKKLENLTRAQLEDLLVQLRAHTLSVEKKLADSQAELDRLRSDTHGQAHDASPATAEASTPKASAKAFYKLAAVRILTVVIVTAAVAALVNTYIFPVMRIFGSSMSSTLVDGDIVIMHKTDALERGDICGFYYGGRVLCKRVIGTPGDEIDIDSAGNVFVNGEHIAEPYIKNKMLGDSDVDFPCTVPEASYFVLGDNRRASVDSRNAVIGFVSEDQIAGKLLLCVWPLPSFGGVG